MDYCKIITIKSGKMGGKPCVRGMRITVSDVLDYLASGMSEDEILHDFPDLIREDVRAFLALLRIANGDCSAYSLKTLTSAREGSFKNIRRRVLGSGSDAKSMSISWIRRNRPWPSPDSVASLVGSRMDYRKIVCRRPEREHCILGRP